MATPNQEPGTPINLTQEQKTALGGAIHEILENLESDHDTYIRDTGKHWDWYDAKPLVGQRSYPWAGASNIVVPFIQSQTNPAISKAMLTLFSSKMWWTSSENKLVREIRQGIFAYLNRSVTKPFDMEEAVDSWVTEMFVIGESLAGQRWKRDERPMVIPGQTKPKLINFGEGAEFYHRPREHWLWNRGTHPKDSEFLCEVISTTWTQLQHLARIQDGWDEAALERIRDQRGFEGAIKEAEQRRRRSMGQKETPTNVTFEPYDIRQCSITWPMFRSMDRRLAELGNITHLRGSAVENISVPIQVWVHRKSREVLRAIYYPHLLSEWPVYYIRYRKRPGDDGHSQGMAKGGEHVQRGMSSMFNQGIDALTKANSMNIVTTDANLARRELQPNTIPVVKATDDVRKSVMELGTQKQIQPDMLMVQALDSIGQRLYGQGDAQLGREVSIGGHPSPATNFLGQERQTSILSSRPIKSIRKALSMVGTHRFIMAQQYEKNEDDWMSLVFGKDDAELINRALNSEDPLAATMTMDVHSLSEIHNPDEERQKAVLIDQMVTAYVNQAMQWLEVKSKAMQQIGEDGSEALKQLSSAIDQALAIKSEVTRLFLEASEVDEIEDFVIKFQEAQEKQLGAFGNLQQAFGQVDPTTRGASGGDGGPALAGDQNSAGATASPAPRPRLAGLDGLG